MWSITQQGTIIAVVQLQFAKITTRPGWCDDSLLLLLLLLLLLFICVCVSAVDNIHMKTCMAYEDVIKAQPTHEVSPSADEEAL